MTILQKLAHFLAQELVTVTVTAMAGYDSSDPLLNQVVLWYRPSASKQYFGKPFRLTTHPDPSNHYFQVHETKTVSNTDFTIAGYVSCTPSPFCPFVHLSLCVCVVSLNSFEGKSSSIGSVVCEHFNFHSPCKIKRIDCCWRRNK